MNTRVSQVLAHSGLPVPFGVSRNLREFNNRHTSFNTLRLVGPQKVALTQCVALNPLCHNVSTRNVTLKIRVFHRQVTNYGEEKISFFWKRAESLIE